MIPLNLQKLVAKKMKRIFRNLKFIWQLLRGKRHPGLSFTADVSQVKDGKEIWSKKGISAWWNGLMDEGEKNVLNTYFRATETPTTFYLGLGNNGGTPGIPAETATLATITEPTGDGYARIEIERSATGFPTLDKDVDGDYYVVSKQLTFENTGATNWSACDYMFLTDVASGTAGKLLVTIALSSSRVLEPSTQLICRISKGKLS